MKKITLSIIAVLVFGFTNAQETKFGVKAGINYATLTGDLTDGITNKIGFNVGGFAEIKLTEKFSVQPELLYSTQGAQSEDDSDAKLNFDYLNIPVMAKYYVAEKFSLEAGPQIGFLLSAKSTNGDDDLDVKDELKSIDFGINFGAGFDFTENLSAGIRYNLGLANILEEDDDAELKNSVFSLSVGYKF